MTNAITYIYNSFGYEDVNYLDDLGGAERAENAEVAYRELQLLLKDFGLCEAHNKSCAPSWCMVFLGIEVNTILLTLSIPKEKMDEILQVLSMWVERTSATLRDVQKLAGLLNFACRCIRSGRVYLARILNFLRSAPPTGAVEIPCDTQTSNGGWSSHLLSMVCPLC